MRGVVMYARRRFLMMCSCPGGDLLLPRPPARRPAPVRRFLPELIDLIWNRTINPGRVFDLELPLEEAAEGYQAMDQRRAIKFFFAHERYEDEPGASPGLTCPYPSQDAVGHRIRFGFG